MAGLNETLAALAASRRWSPPDHGQGAGRLREVGPPDDNPGGLRMLVHAPDDLAAGAALVVVLHGCTQTAEAYAEGAGWLTLADRFGFVVLCPEQTRANNPNLCFNWFQDADASRGAGEAASIRAMIARAVSDHDLDPRRVFITGLSAGGAMANVMLAAYPEVFAGGGIVAGLAYGAASNVQEAFAVMRGGGRRRSAEALGDAVRAASSHAGPWPRVSIWQGDQDATVAPGAADDLVGQWTDVHGVGDVALQDSASDPARRRRTVWRSADGEGVVELHRIAAMGHGAPLACALPDGCGAPGPYLIEVGVSSTLEMAKSWGLTGAVRERRPDAAAASARGPAEPRRSTGDTVRRLRPAAPRIEDRVGKVITDALRSAGLMK